MSAENIWFPFYVGDYLADTMHLSALEHGVYFLLLASYYKNQGPLPDDDKRLANITRLSLSDWSATRSAMTEFFEIRDGKWFHKRADKEINQRKSTQLARQQGAKRTNEARWGDRSPIQSPIQSPSRSSVGISQSHSQSDKEKKGNTNFTPPSIEEVLLLGAKAGLPESESRKFHAFYESKGWMVGKNRMKSLNGAISGWKLRWQDFNPQVPSSNGHTTIANGRPALPAQTMEDLRRNQ